VRIERTLYRVVAEKPKAPAAKAASAPAATELPDNAGRLSVTLEPVSPGSALDTSALYVDEIQVTSDKPLRWALAEVALPPGAAVEPGTWGITIGDKPLERAQHEPTAQGYAVPIEALKAKGSVTVRHLVRFAQRGQFKLPPTRLHRMYEPEAKAFDTSGQWLQMEVH
jgi:uncharacterized protein YfaS (alpha-2-macroglobulin family)